MDSIFSYITKVLLIFASDGFLGIKFAGTKMTQINIRIPLYILKKEVRHVLLFCSRVAQKRADVLLHFSNQEKPFFLHLLRMKASSQG